MFTLAERRDVERSTSLSWEDKEVDAHSGRPGEDNLRRVGARRLSVYLLSSTPPSSGCLRPPFESPQYISDNTQRLLLDNGIICSMSRAGNVWDISADGIASFVIAEDRTDSRKVYRTRNAARADGSTTSSASTIPDDATRSEVPSAP